VTPEAIESRPRSFEGASARRWSTGRILATVVVVAMVGMWGFVLYLAFGPGRQPSPDRLTDPRFAVEAQARCQQALAEVDQLPPASEMGSAAERAGVVEEANASFEAMVDDLEALAPSGEEGAMVMAWLADWRTYLADRADYVRLLQADEDARLLVSAKDGQHITRYIDTFASDNSMPACSTPLDVS